MKPDASNDQTPQPAATGWGTGLKSGIAAIAILVSATSVTNAIFHVFTLPMSGWLHAVTSAYQNLLHPIIDATLGRVFYLFGMTIVDPWRDVLVFYSIGVGAFYRMQKNQSDTLKVKLVVLLVGLFWPAFFPIMAAEFFSSFIGKRGRPGSHDYIDRKIARGTMGEFMREILYVILIVVAAIVLNEAGILV